MSSNHYSVGTAHYDTLAPEALLVARAVKWLLDRERLDGIWAGPDALDEFISTTHVAMTLMAVGISPDSRLLTPALEHLANIDVNKQIAFYWRSGAFLKLRKYRSIVIDDAKYVWSYRDRVAVHRDYPVHFFLLKLLRFGELEREVPFSLNDVLQRILRDWNQDTGWYDRTSITSMAVALIYDLKFKGRAQILAKSVDYIIGRYRSIDENSGMFSDNLVDDAFLVFNLCENPFLQTEVGKPLAPYVEKVVAHLQASARDQTYWVVSNPPFGGSVGDTIYPTAVIVRALLSFFSTRIPHFSMHVVAALVDTFPPRSGPTKPVHIKPFWGDFADDEESDLCFVLMPFSPPKLTEIYDHCVKKSVEEMGLRCIRADDIFRPGNVMVQIWDYINRASIVVAELTDKNPNVFYELGMAHVLGKKVILISQSEQVIPFDLRSVRHILYSDSPNGYQKLASDITKAVQAIQQE